MKYGSALLAFLCVLGGTTRSVAAEAEPSKQSLDDSADTNWLEDAAEANRQDHEARHDQAQHWQDGRFQPRHDFWVLRARGAYGCVRSEPVDDCGVGGGLGFSYFRSQSAGYSSLVGFAVEASFTTAGSSNLLQIPVSLNFGLQTPTLLAYAGPSFGVGLLEVPAAARDYYDKVGLVGGIGALGLRVSRVFVAVEGRAQLLLRQESVGSFLTLGLDLGVTL